MVLVYYTLAASNLAKFLHYALHLVRLLLKRCLWCSSSVSTEVYCLYIGANIKRLPGSARNKPCSSSDSNAACNAPGDKAVA